MQEPRLGILNAGHLSTTSQQQQPQQWPTMRSTQQRSPSLRFERRPTTRRTTTVARPSATATSATPTSASEEIENDSTEPKPRNSGKLSTELHRWTSTMDSHQFKILFPNSGLSKRKHFSSPQGIQFLTRVRTPVQQQTFFLPSIVNIFSFDLVRFPEKETDSNQNFSFKVNAIIIAFSPSRKHLHFGVSH